MPAKKTVDGVSQGASKLPARQRKTQAERSAATRGILLEAAIKCLFAHGYGATTTIMVAETAGVSRGAMLHQFPSKADLMTFVVEEVFEDEVRQYAKLLKGVESPRERLFAYPLAVWKLQSRPAGVAVLEIFQGSRSDVVLAKKLKPVQARIEKAAVKSLESEFPHGVSIPLMRLIVGAARGLAISQLIAPFRGTGKEAIELFQDLLRASSAAGFFRPAADRATNQASKTDDARN